MDIATAIVIDGLIYASWLFLVGVGLTLVAGVMKILNVAHGALFAFGAYAAATMIGIWYAAGWSPALSFIIFPAAALAVGLVVGLVMERGVLRLFYGRDEVILLLVTFALFLVFEDLLTLVWGTQPLLAYQPLSVSGHVEVGRLVYSGYSFVMIATAGVCGLALWFALNRLRWGALLRAVIHDQEIAAAMGINVMRFYTVTFVIGSILGAFGGAVSAPTISVQPGIGVEIIILAFVVVVVGGMGNVLGALIGAIMVGLVRAAAVHLVPSMEIFVVYLLMTVVLAIRPEGLFAPPAARKI